MNSRTGRSFLRRAGIYFVPFNPKTKRLANQLQSLSSSRPAGVQRIDSRLMLTGSQRRRLENKTMPVIFGPFRLVDVGPVLVSGRVGDEVVIDE
jgi:hypothetical protein